MLIYLGTSGGGWWGSPKIVDFGGESLHRPSIYDHYLTKAGWLLLYDHVTFLDPIGRVNKAQVGTIRAQVGGKLLAL
jgi:hypothetical protein